jgi:acyl dehydratase
VQVTPYILETVRHGKEAPKRTRVKKSRNHSRQNKRLTPPKLDFLQPKTLFRHRRITTALPADRIHHARLALDRQPLLFYLSI